MKKGFFETRTKSKRTRGTPIPKVAPLPLKNKKVPKSRLRFNETGKKIQNPNPVIRSVQKTTELIQEKRKKDNFQGIQGIDICPICGGVVSWYWSECVGFEKYYCTDKDCLPWPIGGGSAKEKIAKG